MNQLKNKVYDLSAHALKNELDQNPQWLTQYNATQLSDCLVLAIDQKKIESLKVLLDYGIKAQDFTNGKSILCYCLDCGQVDMFKLLIEYGTPFLEQKVADGLLCYENLELISFFIKQGAKEKGLTFSMHYPNEKVIFELLNHDISPKEIGANFILSYEMEDFNQILIKWEKMQLEKILLISNGQNNIRKIKI